MSANFSTRCWHCGEVHDAVSSADPSDGQVVPANGNVSLCFECGAPAIFDDSYSDGVRKPTPTEMRELRQDEQLVRIMEAWREHRREHRSK